MGKLLRMLSVSSLVAMAAVCIGVLSVVPLVAGAGCPQATYYEPCLPAALNGAATPSKSCCNIVYDMGQTWAGAECLCEQAHAQTFGAPFENSVTMPRRCFGANYPNPSGYVCRSSGYITLHDRGYRSRGQTLGLVDQLKRDQV
ncbi:unnamed protein product [Sphagnum balticum]